MIIDFVRAEAGIYRRAETIPGHRYGVQAWGKHVRTASPVELSLGANVTGGEDWEAASVAWRPWQEMGEDVWVNADIKVRAAERP